MLSTREVAEALGVSVYTVRNWLNAGRLQGTRSAGSQRWRVAPEEVERIKAL
ncbi:helix-turn-helix domain-containing protein [Corynebacterium argentoratense]|uniref:helix-turn-helix domain-containing protein n=1 Tax=Corynebacterium argentoratense TaxID=42817 RepID=UPI0036F206B8